MKSKKKSDDISNFAFYIVLGFFIISLIVLIFCIVYFGVLGKTTGFATAYSGYVNLTINTQIALNMTRNTVNWGLGMVNTTGGFYNATLITHGAEVGTATQGNWSGTNALALLVENIGNVNCSLKLQAGKTAITFLGGTGPEYQWNVSNEDTNACGAWGEASAHNLFANVNVSDPATMCNKLDFHENKRGMYIDFRLVVPYDVNATIASGTVQADIITITGDTAAA